MYLQQLQVTNYAIYDIRNSYNYILFTGKPCHKILKMANFFLYIL